MGSFPPPVAGREPASSLIYGMVFIDRNLYLFYV